MKKRRKIEKNKADFISWSGTKAYEKMFVIWEKERGQNGERGEKSPIWGSRQMALLIEIYYEQRASVSRTEECKIYQLAAEASREIKW